MQEMDLCKSSISILADCSYQFITECFSPFTPSFLQTKYKPTKLNQSFKQFERCEYKITCRPPIQLFKTNQDYKVVKKAEENPTQPQKKVLKTHKAANKIFQHNPTDSESLKIYRDLYIYKSLGSVTRKNLEKAIAIYNANRDEIELTRRFTARRNSISHKRDQSYQRKSAKTETEALKSKADINEKLHKEIKYSQRAISSQNKTLLDTETTICKGIGKINKDESQEEIKKENFGTLNELEESSKVHRKKIVVKTDKRILPKLIVRPIERKIKEKKQLALAVLNVSLPSLNETKEGTINSLIKQRTRKNLITNNMVHEEYNCNSYLHLGLEETDENFLSFSNRKRIVNDIRGKVYSQSKNNNLARNKKRGYLLKLPITEAKGKGLNISSSKNFSILTFQEPEKTFTLTSAVNKSLSILPEYIRKEEKYYSTPEDSQISSKYDINSKKAKSETQFLNRLSFKKEKDIGTCELSNSLNTSMNEEYCYRTKNDYGSLRDILLHSQKHVYNVEENGFYT